MARPLSVCLACAGGDIGAAQFSVDEFEKMGSGNLTVTGGDYVDIGGPPGIRLIE